MINRVQEVVKEMLTSQSCGICDVLTGLVRDAVSEESTSYWCVEPRRMLNHLESDRDSPGIPGGLHCSPAYFETATCRKACAPYATCFSIDSCFCKERTASFHYGL